MRIDHFASAGRSCPKEPAIVFDGPHAAQQLVMDVLRGSPVHRIHRRGDQDCRSLTHQPARHLGRIEVVADTNAEHTLVERKDGPPVPRNPVEHEWHRPLFREGAKDRAGRVDNHGHV